MTEYATRQEDLWAGEFGDAYTERCANGVANNIALFSRVLERTSAVRSVLELGANRGLNLVAIKTLLPDAQLSAVEINARAAREIPTYVSVTVGTLLDYDGQEQFDMTISKGLLIHIAPENLPQAYEVLYRSSRRYIVLCEYFNPTPVEVPYRGNLRSLWKRDFAREMLDQYPLSVVDYGFVWSQDPFPQDNLNWWLMEKR